jgi:hypothetical protein
MPIRITAKVLLLMVNFFGSVLNDQSWKIATTHRKRSNPGSRSDGVVE